MTRNHPILLLAATALASLSCTENSPCPAGQQFEKGYCLKQGSPPDGATTAADAATDEGEAAPDTAAPEDGDLDSTEDAVVPAPDFGTACVGPTECGGIVSYCALQPGVPVGYCTAPGCDATPNICPSGWTCFNVGIFKPGEPYICLRP